MRDDLGVVDRREDGGDEGEGGQRSEDEAGAEKRGERENDEHEQKNEGGPAAHGAF